MSMQELRQDLEDIAGTVKGCLEHHGAGHWCVGLVVINPNEDDDSIVLVEPGHEARIKRVIARVQASRGQIDADPQSPTFGCGRTPMNNVRLKVIDGGKQDDPDNR